MSGLTNIEDAMKQVLGISAGIDVGKVEDLVQAIITIAPAIEKGIVDAAPYVEAIVGMIRNGGTPSDTDWAALRARLDAGSAALQAAVGDTSGTPAQAQAATQTSASIAAPKAAPANPTS